MNSAVLINSFCLVILLVVLLGTMILKEANDQSSRRFSILIYAVIAFILLNFVCDLLEGNPRYKSVITITNLLCFFSIDTIIASFAFYLSFLIGATEKRRRVLFHVISALLILRVAVITILFATGNLFTIENGVYIEQEYSSIPYIIAAIIILQLLVVTLINRSCFSVRQLIVIIIYLFLPIPSIIIEVFTSIYSLTPMALTLSVLLIYVLIQAVAIERGKVRESVLEEISTTDLLTNLKNRRAFYNHIADITPGQSVGVIFCDMNKLKYTNDNFGHSEGDKLIKQFSNMLISSFRNEEVFRISGDEFVVIVTNITEEVFARRVAGFKLYVESCDDISAIGYTYGIGKDLNSLISDAESYMYENKQICHERFYQKISAVPEKV